MHSKKVLRVTTSYASQSNPGSGLNSYYHSKDSIFKTFILTENRGIKDYLQLRNVKINLVNTIGAKLSHPDSNFIQFFSSLLLKFCSSIIFFVNSKKIIDKIKPDVVHIYSPIYFVVGLYCKLKFKSVFLQSFHGTDALRVKKSNFLKKLLDLPDKNLTVTKSFQDAFKAKKNISYIGNGFDGSIFFNKSTLRLKRIINVGNLRWQKAHMDLIEAFKQFSEKNDGYILDIVGEGELKEELIQKIIKLNLQNKVLLHGKLNSYEVAKLYNQSEFFVLTSVSEGSPKVILEAQACGLPIIGTNVGDVSEMLGKDSILVSSGNIKEIQLAMHKMMKHCINIDRKIISNDIQIKEWANITKNLDCIYNEELSKKQNSKRA